MADRPHDEQPVGGQNLGAPGRESKVASLPCSMTGRWERGTTDIKEILNIGAWREAMKQAGVIIDTVDTRHGVWSG